MSNESHLAAGNTLLAAGDLPGILANHYELRAPVECEFIRRGFNDHYRVRTGDRQFVLRLYFNGKYYIESISDFRFELELLAFLHENGISVSYPIKRKDGDLIGVLETPRSSRCFALFTFAEGEKRQEIGPVPGRKLGNAVAQLHVAADRFHSPHRRYHLNLEYLLDRPMQLIDQFLHERGKSSTDAYQSFVDDLKKKICALPTKGDAYGLIHGDLHGGNFFFTEEDEPILFDFDHGGYGWRAYDLAACKGSLTADGWSAYLESYQQIRPLSEAELESIPAFRKIRPIWDKGDILAMRTAWGDDREFGDDFADRIVTMFGRLCGG
jgi:Ser/Thr protein kinase RdoA (MazF antagonist)